jgi:hypothetical protein
VVAMIESCLNMTDGDLAKLSARDRADLRKRTCSRCLAGHHELCTTPATCKHYLCVATDEDDVAPFDPELVTPPRAGRDDAERGRDTPATPVPAPAAASHGRCTTCATDHPPAEECPVFPPTPASPPAAPEAETEDEDQVVWEHPGGRTSSVSRPPISPGQVEQLRARPGEWARVRTYASPSTAYTTAGKLRRGKLTSPPGRWSWAGRRLKDGQGGLYAVFHGDGDEG